MDNLQLPQGKKIILFDADCLLCNRVIKFIAERDKNDVFRFCQLQSARGKEICTHLQLSPSADTVVLYEPGYAYYIKAEAAIEIVKALSGFIQCLRIVTIFPLWLRNMAYDYIARNRHKWGKNNVTCEYNLREKLLL